MMLDNKTTTHFVIAFHKVETGPLSQVLPEVFMELIQFSTGMLTSTS